jgi:ketosteroid isomerase-like protein
MSSDTNAAVGELLDRQAIRDCVTRFCRAIDRWDVELVRSCFHADAVVDYGAAFRGTPEDLAGSIIPFHDHTVIHQHHVTNHVVDLDGDVAHAETYIAAFLQRRNADVVDVGGGRYLDRFERRDDEWRIAARLYVWDWGASLTVDPNVAGIRQMFTTGTRDRSDRSYERPLRAEAS